MRFCRECGHKLQEGATFCSECGVARTASINAEKNKFIPNSNNSSSKLVASKTSIIIIVGIILLLGLHVLLESLFSKDRLIENLEIALLEEDGAALAKLLKSSNESIDINEDTVQGLLDYFSEYPEEIQVTMDTLKKHSESYDTDHQEVSVFDSFLNEFEENNLIDLEESGKFLFYERYRLYVEPVLITIKTNYKDTVILIDGKEVGKADSDNFESIFGPILPGNHTITGKLETDTVSISQNETLILDGTEDMVEVGLYLESEEVAFEMPYPGATDTSAKLYINGKETGVNPFEIDSYGPVLLDGSMTMSVVVELPWGTLKTAESPITNHSIEINLLNEELKSILMDTVHQHHQQLPLAYTSADTTKLLNAHDEYKNWLMEYISKDIQSNATYKVQYIQSLFDVNSISLSNNEGIWEANLVVQLTTQESINNGGMGEKVRNIAYTLKYDKDMGQWLVYSANELLNFNNELVKQYIQSYRVVYESSWGTGGKANSVSNSTTLDPGVDVESIVKGIRKEYNKINGEINQYTKTLVDKDTTIFTNQNQVMKKRIVKSLNAEFYYWDDGSIFFIFSTTNGENRFYFHDNQLIRWINPRKSTINLKEGLSNNQYLQLQQEWLNHAY